MKDVKEVIQTMLDELDKLKVPERKLNAVESELLRLHLDIHDLSRRASTETAIQIKSREINTILAVHYANSPDSFEKIIADIGLIENDFRVLETEIPNIFKKAVLAVDDSDIGKLKNKVSLYIHPDKLHNQSAHNKEHPFLASLASASQEIKNLPIREWNTACDSRELFKKLQKSGVSGTTEELQAMLAKFKRYPAKATAEEIAAIDATNLEVLIYIRDCINSPLLNTTIDLVYQYYRYPELIKNVLYYMSAAINVLLVLGVALSTLALGLASLIIHFVRVILERFYLNQFDEFVKRQGYIYFGRDLQEQNDEVIDTSGASDDMYAADGKAYLMGVLRDAVTNQKMDSCFAKPFKINTEGYIAIFKTFIAAKDEVMDTSGRSDDAYVRRAKQYLRAKLAAAFGDDVIVVFNSAENMVDLSRLTLSAYNDKDYQRLLLICMQELRPAVAAQLEEADFQNLILLNASSRIHDTGLMHYGYVFSSILEDLTKPLPPEDTIFKTMFLRILRFSIALPAALLISFPLSLAQELCQGLIAAVLFTAVSLKLLSAFVFALPLYMYDALAWAVRFCSCQPAPEVDKDQFFKHAANSIFRMKQERDRRREEQAESEMQATMASMLHGNLNAS